MVDVGRRAAACVVLPVLLLSHQRPQCIIDHVTHFHRRWVASQKLALTNVMVASAHCHHFHASPLPLADAVEFE